MPEANRYSGMVRIAWICRSSKLPGQIKVSFQVHMHSRLTVFVRHEHTLFHCHFFQNKSPFLPSCSLHPFVRRPTKPSIGHVNLRIIGISPRTIPSFLSAHLISLARSPSFTFLPLLLLLILARRDFGLFCGIGANSSLPPSLAPSSVLATAVSMSAVLIGKEGDVGASVTRSPLLRGMDGWMDRCFGQLAMFSPFLFVSCCQMCRARLSMLLLLQRRLVLLEVLLLLMRVEPWL